MPELLVVRKEFREGAKTEYHRKKSNAEREREREKVFPTLA